MLPEPESQATPPPTPEPDHWIWAVITKHWPAMKKFVVHLACIVVGVLMTMFLYDKFIIPGKDATIQSNETDLASYKKKLEDSQNASKQLQADYQQLQNTMELPTQNSNLVIDDVIYRAYPHMQWDFRVSNPTQKDISISRVLFIILEIEKGPSAVGRQEISDAATFSLDENAKIGDLLQAPIAINVKSGKNDRFVVNFKWRGKPQQTEYDFNVIPAIKTSVGYVQCSIQRITMQQQIWTNQPINSSYWNFFPYPNIGKEPIIDWNGETKVQN